MSTKHPFLPTNWWEKRNICHRGFKYLSGAYDQIGGGRLCDKVDYESVMMGLVFTQNEETKIDCESFGKHDMVWL